MGCQCRMAGFTLALIMGLSFSEPAITAAAGNRPGTSPLIAGNAAAWDTLSMQLPGQERIDRLQMPPPPQAVLEIYSMAFFPKSAPLEVGLPIEIYVGFTNNGLSGSITSEFRIYFSRDGQLLEKRRPSLSKGLRAGRASSTTFKITLPDKPGRYCWEASLRQTDDGRMSLGGPKTICALLKQKPTSGLMKR